jgi:hypothetical protein
MGHAGHRNVAGSGHSGAGAPERRLGCFGRQRKSDGRDKSLGCNRVVTAMAVTPAGFALFLDVSDFAAGRHFSIAADDAAARQSSEPEKSNKAHDVFNL